MEGHYKVLNKGRILFDFDYKASLGLLCRGWIAGGRSRRRMRTCKGMARCCGHLDESHIPVLEGLVGIIA